MAVDLLDVADVVEPSGDTSLVGHDGHWHPGPVEPGDRLCGALDELDSVDGPDIAVIDDDRPVSVEQDARAGNGLTCPSCVSSTRREGRDVVRQCTDVWRAPEWGTDRLCSCQFGQLRHILLERVWAEEIPQGHS